MHDQTKKAFSASAATKKQLLAASLGCVIALSATTALAQSSPGSPGSTGAAPGGAQSMPPAPSGGAGPASANQPTDKEIATQFKAADANGDGKLTKDEAKVSMPGVHRNFDRIDTKGAGFITQDDLMMAVKR